MQYGTPSIFKEVPFVVVVFAPCPEKVSARQWRTIGIQNMQSDHNSVSCTALKYSTHSLAPMYINTETCQCCLWPWELWGALCHHHQLEGLCATAGEEEPEVADSMPLSLALTRVLRNEEGEEAQRLPLSLWQKNITVPWLRTADPFEGLKRSYPRMNTMCIRHGLRRTF